MRAVIAGLSAGVVMLLAACGGGGGGKPQDKPSAGSGIELAAEPHVVVEAPVTTMAPSGHGMRLSASTVFIEMTEGLETHVQITVSPPDGAVAYPADAWLDVMDPDDRFEREVEGFTFGAGTHTARLWTASNLRPGSYSGHLEVRVCTTPTCSSQLPGSPYKVAYSLKVNAFPRALGALSRIAGAPEWVTYRGNAGHTGYVPVSLDATKFKRRWLWQGHVAPETPDYTSPINPVVVADGTVYVSTRSWFAPNVLIAINEHDGSGKWLAGVSPTHEVNPPAVDGGRIWMFSQAWGQPSLSAFSTVNGQRLIDTPMTGHHQRYRAPVVADGAVFTGAGTDAGFARFDSQTGQLSWTQAVSGWMEEWTPAVDATQAYVYRTNSCSSCREAGLYVYDKADGTLVSRIDDAAGKARWLDSDMMSAPVLSSPSSVLMVVASVDRSTPRLLRFDTQAGTLSWALQGTFTNTPVVADGVLYVAQSNPFRVEARQESTGQLLWTWMEPAGMQTGFGNDKIVHDVPSGSMVLTDSHLFVSSVSRVHALDLRSRQSVWNYPRAGDLALSANGVLYIATGLWEGNGELVAVSLR